MKTSYKTLSLCFKITSQVSCIKFDSTIGTAKNVYKMKTKNNQQAEENHRLSCIIKITVAQDDGCRKVLISSSLQSSKVFFDIHTIFGYSTES